MWNLFIAMKIQADKTLTKYLTHINKFTAMQKYILLVSDTANTGITNLVYGKLEVLQWSWSILNDIDSKILESTDSHLTKNLLFGWLRLIQRQTGLFLMQPFTIFYLLKDTKNFFFKKNLFFFSHAISIISELPVVYFIYPFFLSFWFITYIFFFNIPRYPRFSVPSDSDFFSLLCYIVYQYIYIYFSTLTWLPQQNFD